jgi:NADH-ubiquinone oxidoreductase chain 2
MLILSIVSLIMSNAVNNRRDSSILFNRITILILIYCILLLYNSFYYNFISNGIVLFNGLLCIENYIVIFTLFIFILSLLIICISSVFPLKKLNIINVFNIIKFILNIKVSTINVKKFFFDIFNKENNNLFNYDKILIKNYMAEQYRILEYPLIILFCITGTIFLMSSFDIISIFLSIELQSYALYLICSIYRNSESSISAGLTYFLLGGLSSCIILLGISLIYINSGTTSLENLYVMNNIFDFFTHYIIYYPSLEFLKPELNNIIINNFSVLFTQYLYLQISLIIMSIGFLFKISSAPFHFWSPDVYDAIPTIVTTFVAIIPKISIIIFLYKLIFYTSSEIFSLPWINNIVISSILSLIIGSVLGLIQYRIKRLYAYSTISHLGFILLGLSINNIESTKAVFFYIIQYSASNLNIFIILITMAYTLRNYTLQNNLYIKDINYSPIQFIWQLKGYFNINPFIGISLSITLFSFAGIPPLVGFFAKQMILTAALNEGLLLITLIAIITSVISAVYYLVIIKNMFFEKSEYKLNNKSNFSFGISSYYSLIISIITLLIILFIFFDNELIYLLNYTV